MKLSNLLKKDLKIVEKKKLIFTIPFCVLLAGIIMALVFFFATGSPFNLGMDFTGGYTITVRAGSTLSDQNYDEYSTKIETLVKEFKFEYNQAEYSVQFEDIQKLGSGSETSMRIQYRSDKSIPKAQRDKIMEELNEDLVETINGVVGYLNPLTASISGQTATVTYDKPVKAHVEDGSFSTTLSNNGVAASNISFATDNGETLYNKVQFNFTGSFTEQDIKDAAAINVYFSARAVSGDMISGTVSSDLIYNAIFAIVIALILMLVYIFIRFEFASGVAAVIALFHDMAFMFVMMTVFRIQISSTFIAALITVLGYSINNTIIIFDRVRENRKAVFSSGAFATASDIANKSIKESLSRNIITSITTLIMIGMIAVVCAIGGITDMVNFALPIILGLIAGFYSAVFIAPSLWVVFKRNDLGTLKSGRIQPIRRKDGNEALDTTK